MASTADIALLLVDDDAIVRAWMRGALAGSGFRIAGETGGAAEAMECVERRRIDLLLIDQLLPDWTGTELVAELRRRGCAAPAVLMTSTLREGLNEAARAAGIQGTVVKSSEPEELLHALRSVSTGETAFGALHPRAEHKVGLSPREREILQLIAEGRTNIEIAELLGISRETVKTMLYRAFTKLRVKRRSDAVAEAQRLGLLRRAPRLDR